MQSTWQKTLPAAKTYPPLVSHISCDVVIVGGGITGITLAYMLSKEGKKVVVLEKGTLRESTTAYTTAFLTAEVDTRLQYLQKIFGRKAGNRVWRGGVEAIAAIEGIIAEEGIECEFMRVPGYIFANNLGELEEISEEARRAQAGGFTVEMHAPPGLLPFRNSGYALFQHQAKFHPLKYCEGVRAASERKGARFYEHTEARDLIGDAPVVVSVPGGSVRAEFAAICTYNPFNKPASLYGKKGMYLSYIYELSVPRGILPEGIYVDGANPYHYFRIDRGAELDRMIVGGEDHREEIRMNEEKNFSVLLEYVERILPGVSYRIEGRWKGGVLETWDGLPFIGPYSREYPHQTVATGFSGNGMTYSMIAASIIRDYVLGRSNSYASLYHPRRPYSVRAAYRKGLDYIAEFIHGALKNMFRSG